MSGASVPRLSCRDNGVQNIVTSSVKLCKIRRCVGQTHLAHVHAVHEDAGHAKGGALLVDVRVVIAGGGPCGARVVHADGPLVVLHYKDDRQLVEAGHVQALVELACWVCNEEPSIC